MYSVEEKLSKGFGKVVKSCLTLRDPMDCSLPGSSIHGISQAGYWSRLLFPSPGDLSNPGIEPVSPVSLTKAGQFFCNEPPGRPMNYQDTTAL